MLRCTAPLVGGISAAHSRRAHLLKLLLLLQLFGDGASLAQRARYAATFADQVRLALLEERCGCVGLLQLVSPIFPPTCAIATRGCFGPPAGLLRNCRLACLA